MFSSLLTPLPEAHVFIATLRRITSQQTEINPKLEQSITVAYSLHTLQ